VPYLELHRSAVVVSLRLSQSNFTVPRLTLLQDSYRTRNPAVEWEPGIVDCRLAPVVVRREIRAEKAGRAEDWMLGS